MDNSSRLPEYRRRIALLKKNPDKVYYFQGGFKGSQKYSSPKTPKKVMDLIGNSYESSRSNSRNRPSVDYHIEANRSLSVDFKKLKVNSMNYALARQMASSSIERPGSFKRQSRPESRGIRLLSSNSKSSHSR